MTFECLIQTALSSALFHRRCTALEEWIVVRKFQKAVAFSKMVLIICEPPTAEP